MRSIVNTVLLGISVLALLAGGFSLHSYEVNSKRQYEAEIAQKSEEIQHLKEDLQGMESKLGEQQKLLDSRNGFIESLNAAKAALSQAGKVTDVQESFNIITQSQEVAYQDRANPTTVRFETEKIKKETGRLLLAASSKNPGAITPQMMIAPEEVDGDTENLKTLPTSHPARLALNAVGGTDIRLGSAKQVCASDRGLGCAYKTKVILLAEQFTNESYDYYYPIMMHEFAHQVQYKYSNDLSRSKQFEELFHNDYEWMADCMSAAKITGFSSNYHYKCSSEQVEYGAAAWNGDMY